MKALAAWRRRTDTSPESRSSFAPAAVLRGPCAVLAILVLTLVLTGKEALVDNECGTVPTGGGTIECDENSYSAPSTGPGIEYQQLGDNNTDTTYTINLSGSIAMKGESAHGVAGRHTSTSGALNINMSGDDITTNEKNSSGIKGEHSGSGGDLNIQMRGGQVQDGFRGIYANSSGSSGNVRMDLADDVIGSGNSHAITANALTRSSRVNVKLSNMIIGWTQRQSLGISSNHFD